MVSGVRGEYAALKVVILVDEYKGGEEAEKIHGGLPVSSADFMTLIIKVLEQSFEG